MIVIEKIYESVQKLPESLQFQVLDFVEHLLLESEATQVEQGKIQDQQQTVFLPFSEYEQLLRYKRLAMFDQMTREFGERVEQSQISEQELMAELEASKQQVFSEKYG